MITTLTTAPVLRHLDREWQVINETDASDYPSTGVLSQYDNEGVQHPGAYYSKKHTPVECNYNLYDKELMVIITAHEAWKPECEAAAYPLLLFTDDENWE